MTLLAQFVQQPARATERSLLAQLVATARVKCEGMQARALQNPCQHDHCGAGALEAGSWALVRSIMLVASRAYVVRRPAAGTAQRSNVAA